jgi:hypothetical protein
MQERRVNFADPDFEPSDEELVQLSREAFAGILEAREKSLAELRERIARAREAARTEFARRHGSLPGAT